VSVRIEGLSVTLGVPVLRDVDLELRGGETTAILGPSGSGKSTLLRAIAGLERPQSGRVLLAGSDLAGVPAHRRGIGLMFQDGNLFPHRDVAGNVEFGLRMAGVARAEREGRVTEVLELVGLAGFGGRSVARLSGGERQRVALARALAPEPRVLLLDEPVGSLDGPLRERLLADLDALFDRLGLTVAYVTHDVAEAFALGDSVAVLRDGTMVQQAAPEELWAAPADAWTAGFLGLGNVRDGTVIRPEAVRVTPGSGAVVLAATRLGPAVRLRVRLESGEELDAVTTALDHPSAGDSVAVEIDPAGVIELRRRSYN
jgi:thiamine transport system ATP-binding protein